jgi:signal peptidase II
LKRYYKDYLFLFLVAGIVILLDQWTKSLVRTQLVFSDQWAPWPWLLPYIRIVHWNNTGVAFGMFQGMNLVFSIVAFCVSGFIIYYFPRIPREDWLTRLGLSLTLGGAIGNLIDRLQYGTVTDFVSVGNFAVFNVADASISVGVVLMAIDFLIKDRRERRQKAEQNQVSKEG